MAVYAMVLNSAAPDLPPIETLRLRTMPTSKGLPSSLVQLRSAVWTGDTRDTRPKADVIAAITA